MTDQELETEITEILALPTLELQFHAFRQIFRWKGTDYVYVYLNPRWNKWIEDNGDELRGIIAREDEERRHGR